MLRYNKETITITLESGWEPFSVETPIILYWVWFRRLKPCEECLLPKKHFLCCSTNDPDSGSVGELCCSD